VVQVLFLNNDAIFQDNDMPIDTARSVQEHEDALQHLLWLAQSPNFNIIKSLSLVLENSVRSRFPPSSLKQLEDYSIPLETIQDLHNLFEEGYKMCYSQWWPTSILIKTYICVSFTAVSIIFVHLQYMLPGCIPWGD